MSRPRITSLLFGGLGNQLFIYAFTKALSERCGVPCCFDVTSGFKSDRVYKRRFLLDRLVEVERASAWESRAFTMGHLVRSLERRLNRRLSLERRWLIHETKAAFNPAIFGLRVRRPTLFCGAWQSPKYFENIDMRRLIRFPEALSKPLANDVQAIQGCNAVCLAIRRFEEVPKPGPVLGREYFLNAMARIEEEVPDPHYFVFAQDMNWARANITSRHPVTFASDRDPHDGAVQDLYLMKQCRHFILSNSTLHWWAAWLGETADSKVIVPNGCWPNPDIVPEAWVGAKAAWQDGRACR